MSFEHQDWTPVVIRKPKAAPTQTVSKAAVPQHAHKKINHANVASSSHNSDIPAWKIEERVDSESGSPIKRVTREDAQAIIQGRVAKKLTQAQLAQRLNLTERDIKDIECGKAVENKAMLSRIKKFLNT